jgi:hypothetical protein
MNNEMPGFSLAQHIGTRNGTLSKDSKLVNLLKEVTPEGEVVIKRPGLDFFKTTVGTAAQGLITQEVSGVDKGFAIFNNTIYDVFSLFPAAPIALPVGSLGYSQNVFRFIKTAVFSAQNFILSQNAAGLWYTNITAGFGISRVIDVNFPTNLATPLALTSSLCELDGTYYVQDETGMIRGSAINDFTVWPALNFIQPSYALGRGRGMIRHLNYIVAFYAAGIQFYFDANNPPPGSPLLPVQNASFTLGCFEADTIVELEDVTYFVSTDNISSRSVHRIVGMQIELISNPAINRILQTILSNNRLGLSDIHAYGMKVSGHNLYVIQIVTAFSLYDTTLVYDSMSADWQIFSSVSGGVEVPFKGFTALMNRTGTYFQSNTGDVYRMNEGAYQDITGPINALIRTEKYNWGNLKRKHFSGMYLIGDTVGSTISIRYSDDDYTTYSAYRVLDLSTKHKMIRRCGSSRQRSWDLLHTANTPLRLLRAELDMKVGPA